MAPADRLRDALLPYARLAAPRAGGGVEIALHDSWHGPWTTIRWGRARRLPGDPWPSLPRGLSAHARLAETAARAAIADAEGGGLARAMMAALGLPRWILGGLALEIRAEIRGEGEEIRLDAGLLGGPAPQDGRGGIRIGAVADLCAEIGPLPWRDLHWWGDPARGVAFPAPADGGGQDPWRRAWLSASAALGGTPDDGSPARRLRPLLRAR